MRKGVTHQRCRYLFQGAWLLILTGLAAAGAGGKAWAGLLVAGIAAGLLVRRAACSCACPLFPLGELLWRGGERLFGRTFTPPFWLDLLLRSAKYLVMAGIAIALIRGEPLLPAAVQFSTVAALAGTLLVLSLFFQLPWCRYLCPAGALLGLISTASRLKIRRSPRHCVRCHRCDQRCPANLAVMLGTSVHSPECFACYRCVDGCPAPGALDFASPGGRPLPAWQTGIAVSALLLAGLLVALSL